MPPELLIDRREIVRADVMRRLKSVCSNMSEDDFVRLVDEIVERQLKFEVAK